ncbi:MAG: FAD:protein FMN transferase [bacterium]
MSAGVDAYVRSTALMGTVVSMQVIGHCATDTERVARDAAVDRAFEWCREIEACCSRFDPTSEVSRLLHHVGEAVPASPMLFGALRFALALAQETGGAFDPTIGHLMEARGDNIAYRTRAIVNTAADASHETNWRDVHVDADAKTVTLLKPLMLDLGAVAKGLAVDLAMRELRDYTNFAIDAGGDLYLGGTNAMRAPWVVGIRHPREVDALIQTLHVSNVAVCTSGDYERRLSSNAPPDEHHIIDPRSRTTASASISATVIASSAMVADALATAAFVIGGRDGIALLEQHSVDGLIISKSLERFATRGLSRYVGAVAS